jgi:hypothetical protein
LRKFYLLEIVTRPTIIQHTLHDPSGSNIPGIRFMDGSLPLVAVHLGTGSTF